MPIYEYRCNNCGDKVSLFLRSFSQKAEPVCDRCNSTELTRLVSRVVTIKSEVQRLQELDSRSAFSGLDPMDLRSTEQWARRAGNEYDELLGTNFAEQAAQMDGSRRPYELYDPAGNFAIQAKKKFEEATGAMEGPKTWRQAVNDEIIDYHYSGDPD